MLRRLAIGLVVFVGVLSVAAPVPAAEAKSATPACELLTQEDAEGVVGADVSELFPGRLASLCTYATEDATTALTLMVYAGPRSAFPGRPKGDLTPIRIGSTRGWSIAPTPHTPSAALVMYRDGLYLTVLAKGTADDVASAKKAMRMVFSKL